MTADNKTYLADLVKEMNRHWPQNRTINIVCHGHSVPSGYFATPMVDTFNAYPHLLHRSLKERFPFAVINVIVTAIGGENSEAGAKRFESEVLCHRADLITIDYGLNDRRIGLEKSEEAWSSMIEKAMEKNIKLLLLTPTLHIQEDVFNDQSDLKPHVEQIRQLAGKYGTGLVDSYAAFEKQIKAGTDLSNLLSWSNHPSRKGHELVRDEIMRWFSFN